MRVVGRSTAWLYMNTLGEDSWVGANSAAPDDLGAEGELEPLIFDFSNAGLMNAETAAACASWMRYEIAAYDKRLNGET